MKNLLKPIPDKYKSKCDDAFYYRKDWLMYYNEEVDKDLVDDIQNNNLQIFGAHYDYKDHYETPIIKMISYGDKSGKQKFKIQGFKPYTYRQNPNGDYKDIEGNAVEKVIFNTHPAKVRSYRQSCMNKGSVVPKEADVLYINRLMVDLYDYFKSDKEIYPPSAVVDVETNYPESDDMISYAVNFINGRKEEELHFNAGDSGMVLALELLNLLDDTIVLTGWNFDFDVEIINNHLEQIHDIIDQIRVYNHFNMDKIKNKLSFDLRLGSPSEISRILELLKSGGYIRENKSGGFWIVEEPPDKLYKRFVNVDLREMARTIYPRELKGGWSLENVGAELCTLQKFPIDCPPRELDDETLLEYNTMDVVIPEEIDDVLGCFLYYIMLAWDIQVPLDELLTGGFGSHEGRVNDIVILREYHKAGIVLNSKSKFRVPEGKSEKGKGDYDAADPKARPGIYEGVLVVDFKACYPSIVKALNASYETKDPNGELEAANGVRFNKKSSVFINSLNQLLERRKKIKREMEKYDKDSSDYERLKKLDFAIKTQTAAFSHGIFGQKSSRMPDLKIAEAIASTAKYFLTLLEEKTDEMEYPWNYCHSDSLMLKCPKERTFEIIATLNAYIDNKAKEKGYLYSPYLEFEGYWKKAYIHSAARNVLVPEDSDNPEDWKVTGMNFYRVETPDFLAEVEKKSIKDALDGFGKSRRIQKLNRRLNQISQAKSINLGLVKPLNKPPWEYGRYNKDKDHKWHDKKHSLEECIQAWKSGKWDSIPYHIKAYLNAWKDYGFKLEVGQRFMMLPVKNIKSFNIPGDISFDMKEGLPDDYEIDYDDYLRRTFYGKIYELFNCADDKDLERKCKFNETLENWT